MTGHPSASGQPAERLDSWKEIARYLGRDESTVQRWEKREGMPVHRHVHAKRGSVYAFSNELDAWWQGRRQLLDPPKAATRRSEAQLPLRSASEQLHRPVLRRWTIVVTLVSIAAGLMAVNRLVRWRAPEAAPSGLVRLTSTSGLNIDPALSPDGSLLAYASDRSGAGELDIWIQPINQEQPVRITHEPGDELEPSFSPTGESIAFARGEGGGIYVVDTAGGAPRQVSTAARARTPRFSPDGQWLTYWTGLPLWGALHPAGAMGALFVVPLNGGTPRQLAAEFGQARCGLWSPEGSRILFLGARERDGTSSSLDWYVVDMRTGEAVRTGALEVLRRAGVKGMPIPGAWGGDRVVTFATYDDGASHVGQLEISPATGRVVGEPVRLTFGTSVERSPAVSASGRVVFASIAENVDVWRLALRADAGAASGALERVTDNAASDRLWGMSDDGRTMVFVSSRSGQDEVWVRDVSTGHERQITSSNARGARISRDGSMIAIHRGIATTSGTDVIPASGLAPSSSLCDDCVPGDWSPDDRRLLLQRGTPSRLAMRDLASGVETELAAHPTWNLFQPRISPDGRWAAFHTTNGPSLRQIYAVPTWTNASVPFGAWVPAVTDFGVQPSWAEDGTGLYHFSLRDGAFCAWVQPVDPATKRPVGSPRAVRHFHQPGLRAAAAAAATNDVAAGYLYVTLTSSAANIWMLER